MYFSVTDKYITNSQDTVYKIATKFYFKWWLWRVIYDYNRQAMGNDPWDIPAGKEIKIIGLNTEDMEHTAIAGDSWAGLSEAYYGSMGYFNNIARANDFISPAAGGTVIIPALVTAGQIENARRLRNAVS